MDILAAAQKVYAKINTVFYRILFVFVIAIVIPVACISLLSIKYSTDQILRQVEQSSIDLLEEKKYSLDQRMKEIDSLTQQIISDARVWRIVGADAITVNEYLHMMDVIRYLNSVMVPIKHIESIYLVDRKLDYVLSTTKYTLDSFHDPSALQLTDREGKGAVVRYFGYKKVISYYRNFNFLDRKRVNLIINFDYNKFFQELNAADARSAMETFVLDEDFNVVYSSGRHIDAFDREALSEVGEAGSGEHIHEAGHTKYFLSKTDLNTVGWTIGYIQPYSSLVQTASLLRKIILVATAAALILSLLLAFLYTIYLYKPMAKLLLKLREYVGSKHADVRNEYTFIDRAVMNLSEEKKQLESQIRLTFPYFQMHSLHDLLAYRDFDASKFNSIIDLLGVKFNHARNMTVLVDFEGVELTTQRMEEIDDLLAACGDRINAITSKIGYNRLAAVLNTDEPPERVYAVFEKIRQHFNANDILLTIAIGKPYEQLSNIGISYREALQQMNGKFFIGINSIIVKHMDVPPAKNPMVFYDKKIEEELLTSIKAQNLEKSKSILEKFTNDLMAATHSIVFIKYVYFQVVSHMIHALADFGIQFDDTGISGPRIFSAIENAETLQDLQQYVMELIGVGISLLSALKKRQHTDLVKKTTLFLKDNYNKDLSLEDIAGMVFLSPRYLSSLFKAETGMTPFDYITKLRMEAATRLLSVKDYKIQDIAQAIGYNNVQSFIRVFKNSFNMTPVEYRRKRCL